MSAVPLPKAEPDLPATAEPSSSDAEGWALLEALRRRLDDQGAQGRKTQHQVTQLADSIGALVAEQRRRSKWANLNSFVAYLIFTLLVGAGFYLLYRSRAHELVEARDAAQRERDQATKRADDADAKATARAAADTKAWEVYQLLDAGKRSEAAGKLAALGDLPLSRTERAVLAARAHETQVMEVDSALKAAATSFRAGRYAEVIAPLEAALISEPAGARASTMRYYLGIAYAKGNQLDRAITLLTTAVAAEVEQEDARFQLASALDRAGQYARARTEYDRFATAHPQSQLAVFAMRRSATLARMPATAVAPAPVAPVVPAPTAVQPAPSGAQTPAPATKPAAPPTRNAVPATKPVAPAVKPMAPAPKPIAPATKPAPATAPKPEPAPESGATGPAPDTTPMAATSSERGATVEPRLVDELSRSNPAEPFSVADTGRPSKAKDEPKAPPSPKQEPKPAPEPPKAEPPKAEPPRDIAPKVPPPARAEPLPAFPIERTPPPSPLGPPIEREPAPSPNAPPRGDVPPPPPSRF